MLTRNIITVFLFFIFICFYSISLVAAKINVNQKDDADTISFPFINKKGWIFFKQISLNSEVVREGFLFDSGSNVTLIDFKLFKKLNLKIIKQTQNTDANNKVALLNVVIIPSLKIGEIEFTNVLATLADLSIYDCEGMVGIIGNNILKKAIWKIDFLNNKISVLNEFYTKKNYHSISFKYKNNLPYVVVTANGKKYNNVLFDTGARALLNLKTQDTLNFFDNERFKIKKYISFTNSIYDSIKRVLLVPQIKLDKVSIGTVTMNNVPVNFRLGRIMGINLFQNTILIIDYKNKMILTSDSILDQNQYLKKDTGIKLDVNNKGEVFISSILVNSPAERFSLRLGDKVVSLNNIILKVPYNDKCSYIEKLNELMYDNITIRTEYLKEQISISLQ